MKIEKALEKYNMLLGAKSVLCALSGGADSVALTHYLAKNAQKLGISVKAAHFSHGIRKDAAVPEKELCERLCKSLGIELFYDFGDCPAYAKEHNMGLENAARELRYAFLEKTAKEHECAVIATAHHLNDNAETVIMNIIRGAYLQGLCGIPPKRPGIIRPLILTSRAEIEEYIEQNGLEFATDMTNFEPCCRRNVIRLDVIPRLLEEEPAAIENIGALSILAREALSQAEIKAKLLEDAAFSRNGGLYIEKGRLLCADEQAASMCISALYKKSGGRAMLTRKHIEAVMKLCENKNPSASVCLPGMKVSREYKYIVFGGNEPEKLSEVSFSPGDTVRTGKYLINCVYGKHPGFIFDKNALSFPLTVRSRREGDVIFWGGHHKSVKKLLTDKKFPAKTRDSLPVLCNNDKVIGVYPLGWDTRIEPKDDQSAVTVIIEEV